MLGTFDHFTKGIPSMISKPILKISICLLALSFFSTNIYANTSSFVGKWKGSGTQSNGSSWDIHVKIAGKSKIDYPSLGCGGDLILREKESNQWQLSEKLTYGKKNCVNNGKVVLIKKNKNELEYRWYYSNGKLSATGKLKRQ